MDTGTSTTQPCRSKVATWTSARDALGELSIADRGRRPCRAAGPPRGRRLRSTSRGSSTARTSSPCGARLVDDLARRPAGWHRDRSAGRRSRGRTSPTPTTSSRARAELGGRQPAAAPTALRGADDRLLRGPARRARSGTSTSPGSARPPPGSGTWVHTDIIFMGRGTRTCGPAWVPYGDIPRAMGGLAILERSHQDETVRDVYGRQDVDTYCENLGQAPGRLTSGRTSTRC